MDCDFFTFGLMDKWDFSYQHGGGEASRYIGGLPLWINDFSHFEPKVHTLDVCACKITSLMNNWIRESCRELLFPAHLPDPGA